MLDVSTLFVNRGITWYGAPRKRQVNASDLQQPRRQTYFLTPSPARVTPVLGRAGGYKVSEFPAHIPTELPTSHSSKPRRYKLSITMVQPKTYSQGDRVEYRPIGGTSDKVTHSTGEIIRIEGDGEDAKYTIRNDNTGKETTYQSMNIVGPAQ
ncbi:hypothetical protein FB107DRAFT_271087 [Schizophyllum commune]